MGLRSLVLAGGQNTICLVRLYCSTQILQYGQKGCIVFELRLSRVPQALDGLHKLADWCSNPCVCCLYAGGLLQSKDCSRLLRYS
ncbi:MAG: hypothetical protein ACOX7R_00555 [Acetivibrionales bacterium]